MQKLNPLILTIARSEEVGTDRVIDYNVQLQGKEYTPTELLDLGVIAIKAVVDIVSFKTFENMKASGENIELADVEQQIIDLAQKSIYDILNSSKTKTEKMPMEKPKEGAVLH